MSKNWDYNGNRIVIEPPKQTLRISGHRFPTVLGLNKWSTPFQAWCEITKTVNIKFEGNKYTEAGKVLEPKIIDYVRNSFPNVMSIEEYYGKSFDEYRYNNFKEDSKIFGGVIDAVATRDDKKTIAMICECKTSSHPEAWQNGNVPIDYLLQGALYSYLKGLDRVLFACTFLDDIDYGRPEDVVVSEKNTILVVKRLKDMIFEVDGEYLGIEGCIQKANEWWDTYIKTGMSPEFDEVNDKEYLDKLRATDEAKDNELLDVCDKSVKLAIQIDKLKKSYGITDLEKQLKLLEASIKNKMMEDGIPSCGKYKLNKTEQKKFNEKEFAEENPTIYDSYCSVVESYSLTKDKKEGN